MLWQMPWGGPLSKKHKILDDSGWYHPVSFTLLTMFLFCFIGSCTVKQTGTEGAKVPVIYCTDLFHPHDDPDDHFDIAALYALKELDIKGIVLDQGKKQDSSPGRIPVEQMNFLTGRHVPWAVGLAEPLKNPDDTALKQEKRYQAGVDLILTALEESQNPVTIITVGSLRDVAAAFNREPGLFRKRVSRLMIFIGEASAGTLEWNVGLDRNAFIGIMNSDLPVWWIPCFDGGNFRNRGNASFWKAEHADLLKHVSDPVMNFFIYALRKKTTSDYLEILNHSVHETEMNLVLSQKRNLWCTAVFTEAAGRIIVEMGEGWASIPKKLLEKDDRICEAFQFVPVSLFVNNEACVVYDASSMSHRVMRFQIKDIKIYPEIMTSVTSRLIGDLVH
jgi:hypothetical protein